MDTTNDVESYDRVKDKIPALSVVKIANSLDL